MRRSLAAALAAPSLALVAAACQCVGPGPDLFACPSAVQDCAWCDRDGRCAILADGGLVDDGGSQPSDAGPDGGASCGPPGATICAPDGGCWEHPLPQGNDLVGVWGAGGAVWAVGAAGTILRWDGAAWTRIPSGTPSDLLSVWTDSAGEAWVSGASGQWFRITAQGARDDVTGFPGPILVDLTDVWSDTGSSKIWASGYSGHVYQASRSSLSATDIATSGVTTQYAAFGVQGGSSVWTVGENGQVSSFDRLTNLRQPRPSLPFDAYDLWMAGETELWVATRDGGVYTGDGSGSWAPQVHGATSQIASAIWGEPGTGELWVRGYDGLSYYRSSSLTWSTAQDPSRLNFRDVWGAGQQIWSVGEKGYIGRWSFDTGRWDARSAAAFPPRPNNAHLTAIHSLGCEAWAAGRNGQLLRRSGNGWEDVPRGPGPAGAITALWAAGPGDVWYARGEAGFVDRVVGAPAGGYPTGLAGPVLGLSGAGSGSGAIWAVGEDGGISRWGGLDWTLHSNPQRSNLHAVLARAEDDVWAAGDQRTVVFYDGGAWGTSLAPSAAGPDLRAIAADSTRVYAVGGATLYTRAPGGNWTPFSAPENLEAVAVDGQGRIWVAGEDAFLAYLQPDGGSWHPVPLPTNKDLHGLSYRDGELLVAGDDGAIFIVRPPPDP